MGAKDDQVYLRNDILQWQGYESDGGESDSSVKTVKSNKSTASSSKSAKANTSNLPLADSIVLDAPLQTNSPKVRLAADNVSFGRIFVN